MGCPSILCARAGKHETAVDKPPPPWYTRAKRFLERDYNAMMKHNLTFPALALAGGAAAFVFRLLQVRTGFEADTGLPIPGNPWGLILIVLLVLVAAALALLAWKLPPEPTAPAFPQAFSTTSTGTLTVLIMGVFLLGVSGVLDLFSGLSAGASLPADAYAITADGVSQSGFSAKEHLILGLLTLLSAVSLFPAAAVCRRPGSHEPSAAPRKTVQGNLLLVPVVCLVIRLVLVYRVDSIDPVLSDYYLELLALVFLTLGFYRLSSFAFGAGRTDRFVLYAGLAVVLCLAVLADGFRPGQLPVTLFHAGGAITLLGFLLLRMGTPLPAGKRRRRRAAPPDADDCTAPPSDNS